MAVTSPLVLLVDDNDSGLDILQRRLSRAGYTVLTATDGEGAVASSVSHRPDLIVMDKRLPQLDGYAAVRRLRSHDRTRSIPVICLTADATREDERLALEAGCQRFLTKPVDLSDLLAAVETLLGATAAGG